MKPWQLHLVLRELRKIREANQPPQPKRRGASAFDQFLDRAQEDNRRRKEIRKARRRWKRR